MTSMERVTSHETVAQETSDSKFTVPVSSLKQFVDDRHKQDEVLASYGGVPGLLAKLHVDAARGLSDASESDKEDLKQRAVVYGANRLPPAPTKSFLRLMFEASQDKTLILLFVAAIVSIILGTTVKDEHGHIEENGWIEGVAILGAVFLVIFVTSANDFQKEKQFRKLNDKKNNRAAKVIRGGHKKQISAFDLVVGDVIVLEVGDLAPVDGVLVSGIVKMDESAATGESDAVKKSEDGDCIFLSGTKTLDGEAMMVATGVGENSFGGVIAMALRKPRVDTPLQIRLTHMADAIGKFGGFMAVATLLALIIKYFVQLRTSGEQFEGGDFGKSFVQYLITSITIVVVAVPEGLPLAVTIALAYSMVKMLKENNLVRQLSACETMGSATAICSDKTGTLTQNVMTVVRGWTAGHQFEAVSPEVIKSHTPDSMRDTMFHGIALNSTAYESVPENGTSPEFLGSKTEVALLNFARVFGVEYAPIREANKPNLVWKYPFSSAKKRMSVVYRRDSNGFRLHSKGASEIVLANCDRYVDNNGDVQPMSSEVRKEIEAAIFHFASNALRTICLAYKDLDAPLDWESAEPDVDMICLGVVGIEDPLRAESAAAVEDCKLAGITVRMVTGDNLVTAKNIAKKCGIYDDTGLALEGPVFRAMSDDQLRIIVPRLQVLARSSPLDKRRLVGMLQSMGEVVAVTGDGTNDAPALSMANVGFAMGIAGTEVAKEAAAIILMDDNFRSIVNAVLWGRNVFDSIRKFIQFQLTVNVVAVTLAFVGALTDDDSESPLTPVQLLWVNLIMDTFAALALATEHPARSLLYRRPIRSSDPLINRRMWLNILGQSAYQLGVCFWVLYDAFRLFSPSGFDPENNGKSHVQEGSREHLSIFFNTFVMLQVFNEINSRNVTANPNVFRGILRNYLFLSIIVGTIIVQALLVQFGGDFSSTVGLSGAEWLACIFIGLLGLPWGMMLRMVPDELLYRGTDHQRTAEAMAADRSQAARQRWLRLQQVRTQVGVLNALRRTPSQPAVV